MRNVVANHRGESWGYRGRWRVNCANMWIATLGKRLSVSLAILGHTIIVLHELTHALSGIRICLSSWDRTLSNLLNDLGKTKLMIWS